MIYYFGNELPSEQAPLEDRGRLRGFATAPEGSTFEYMEAYMNEMVDMLKEEIPEREGIISVTSPGFGASSSVNNGFMFVILKDKEERERSQQEIVDGVMPKVAAMTGARTFVSQPQTIGNRRGHGSLFSLLFKLEPLIS